MALPTLDKTWRYKVNQHRASTGGLADYRSLVYAIKTSLTTASGWTDLTNSAETHSNPWTVTASSNSTTANLTDLWAADTNLTWAQAGTAHSWIVLRQNQIVSGQTFEICIDCCTSSGGVNSEYAQLSLAVSPAAGFNVSSPSTLNRPTALDEIVFSNKQYWASTSSASGPITYSLHVCSSDDGQLTRIFVMNTGNCTSFWLFDQPKNVVTGWTYPAVATMLKWANPGGQIYPTYSALNDVAWVGFRAPKADGTGLANGWMALSTESYTSNALCAVGERQTAVNTITGMWSMTKMGLTSLTAGLYGRHGEVSDLWWGSTGVSTGDGYPSSGTTKQFVQFHHIIHPWNTTTPLTS